MVLIRKEDRQAFAQQQQDTSEILLAFMGVKGYDEIEKLIRDDFVRGGKVISVSLPVSHSEHNYGILANHKPTSKTMAQEFAAKYQDVALEFIEFQVAPGDDECQPEVIVRFTPPVE